MRNYGSSVSAAPTSANGDSNWEAMQKYKSLVTDIFLADKANIAGFMFKLNGYTSDGAPYGIMQSQDSTNGQPNLRMDTKTGEILCQKANITGTIIATKGTIGGFNIGNNFIGSTNMSAVNVDNLLLQYDKFEMKYERFQSIDGHLYQGILDTVIRSGSITVSSTGDVSTANDTLYVRCGSYIFSVGRNGIRKSTNGGSTWVDL